MVETVDIVAVADVVLEVVETVDIAAVADVVLRVVDEAGKKESVVEIVVLSDLVETVDIVAAADVVFEVADVKSFWRGQTRLVRHENWKWQSVVCSTNSGPLSSSCEQMNNIDVEVFLPSMQGEPFPNSIVIVPESKINVGSDP